MISLLTNSPWSIFVINILDIAIIAFAVYKILEIMRGTRAMPLAKGVGVLLVFSVLSDVLGTVYQWIVGGAGGLMTLLVRALGLF